VLYAVLLVSATGFIFRLLEYRRAADEYAAIARQMNSTPVPSPSFIVLPSVKGMEPATPAPTHIPDMTPPVYISEQIYELKAQNSDTAGYLAIEGTVIQYPVVRGKDNSYYETHTFSKKKNASGAIFMDSKNSMDMSDFNTVLYGHNMKDGSMFHELTQYSKVSFTRDHRYILLTGLYEKKTFYVFSAYTCARDTDVRGFDLNTEDEKLTFLNVLKNRSEISAGSASLTKGSRIITLVTCRENRENDYFVVHGVLVQ
jgi:sortase B